MKSLLVDVLRQAQDESSEANSSPACTDAQPNDDAPSTDGAVRAADLDLMATGQFHREERVAEDPFDDPSNGLIDEAAASGETPVPTKHGPPADTAAPSELGAVLQTKPPAILRIGRMTPLICLVTVVGVAAGSLFVDSMTGSSLNDGLDEIANPDRITASNESTVRASVRSSVIGATRNNGSAAANAATLDAAPAPAVATDPVNESRAADSAINDYTIDVSRSDAGRSGIDDRAFEQVAEGYAAYQRRDFRSAERFYEQALTIEANHRDALLGIAAVYGQTDRESLALDAYRKVLQIEPGNTMAASAILLTRAASARWDNESDVKLLLQQFPDAHHLHFALGTIYVGEQRWAAARHAFQSAWQLAPSNANYAYNLAVSLERLGDVVEAARYYETALANAGESSNVDRAAVEMHLGQLAIIAREDR